MEIVAVLVPALLLALPLYAIAVSVIVIMDNRSPQSSFAWLLALYTLPLIGLVLYYFFGRSHHFFSSRSKLARQEIGGELTAALSPLLDRQQAIVERIRVERPAAFSHRLLQMIANNSGSLLTEYNEVEILQDAAAKYQRLLEDLRAAQHSIHLKYFIWTNDDFTQQVKEILIEKARAGVKVRALYDATSRKAMGRAYRRELRAAGVQIYPYLDYSSLRTIHNIQYRSHRKIAVIDGQVGYVGGMNLDREQLSGPKGFSGWRDTHLRIHGEAVLALQSSFVVSWFNTTRERVTEPQCFPVAAIQDDVRHFLPVQVTQSGPDSQWAAIRQVYFHMIMAANKHIYMQSPFFIPDQSISEALKAAALSGVDVRLMVQPRGGSYQIPYRAAFTYFAELAEAGVRIYLYENDTYFHAKTLNIDSAICTVGTANMDIRSFSINYEINAVLYDEEKAQELAQDFLTDLQACREFNLAEYREGRALARLRDSVYRLASPVL